MRMLVDEGEASEQLRAKTDCTEDIGNSDQRVDWIIDDHRKVKLTRVGSPDDLSSIYNSRGSSQ